VGVVTLVKNKKGVNVAIGVVSHNMDLQHQKAKWAIFTYSQKENHEALYGYTKCTKNKIQIILKSHPQIDRYEENGI
jgi:Holliday junction resolvasome RuvABC endonuclease subunit